MEQKITFVFQKRLDIDMSHLRKARRKLEGIWLRG